MFAVKVIFPSGAVGVWKDQFWSHRDAHNFAQTHGPNMSRRFGMRVFVGSV